MFFQGLPQYILSKRQKVGREGHLPQDHWEGRREKLTLNWAFADAIDDIKQNYRNSLLFRTRISNRRHLCWT